jgi:hypothetical protein
MLAKPLEVAMTTLDLLLFVAFPYLCLAVFVVGHAYR